MGARGRRGMTSTDGQRTALLPLPFASVLRYPNLCVPRDAILADLPAAAYWRHANLRRRRIILEIGKSDD